VKHREIFVVALLALVCTEKAPAGGPLFVSAQGEAIRWATSQPVGYHTDLGNLGAQNKETADAFVAEAFDVWEDVTTARISFTKAGDLSVDVTAANYFDLDEDLDSELYTKTPVIYDVDGGITDLEFGAGSSNHVLGFAGYFELSPDGGITNARVVLNGKFIDGLPDSQSNPEISLELFKEVVIHEFGHFIGLDHSQVNVEVLENGPLDPDAMAGLPIMFPFLITGTGIQPRPSLAPDDIAAISAIYPTGSFRTHFGRIKGRIFFSDGETPAQGFNVIARKVGESKRVAVSTVSGYFFTAHAGNEVVDDSGSPFGSREQALIGEYDLPGLPPGSYTIEVEAIDPGFDIGPMGLLGFQFPIPGNCRLEYWNASESEADACDEKSEISVGAKDVKIDRDIILNGTPPRLDAWEGARP
jgi:hypothetical protein